MSESKMRAVPRPLFYGVLALVLLAVAFDVWLGISRANDVRQHLAAMQAQIEQLKSEHAEDRESEPDSPDSVITRNVICHALVARRIEIVDEQMRPRIVLAAGNDKTGIAGTNVTAGPGVEILAQDVQSWVICKTPDGGAVDLHSNALNGSASVSNSKDSRRLQMISGQVLGAEFREYDSAGHFFELDLTRKPEP
jgi:hypothetical protein